MRSRQMWVGCGLLAVVVMMMMSTCVSAAPSPGQPWPGLANTITSLEATQIYGQVATPHLDCWAIDWRGCVWLWLSCPTPGAVVRYTLDGSDPKYYSPLCDGLLILCGHGTLKVQALAPGLYASNILVITIH